MGVLYSDYELLLPIEEKILFEGVEYFLDISSHSEFIVKKWISEEHLESSIQNYHPKNKILILRFDNVVGFVNILGIEYDVRSRKLYDGFSGNKQFQSVLDDISDIYNKLSFNFRGTSYAKRENENHYSLDKLEVFDYYYQLAFKFPSNANLDTLINQCLKSPNTINIEISSNVRFEQSKKLTSNFFRSIGNIRKLVKIPDNHSLAHSTFPETTNRKIQKRLLPLVVENSSFSQTTNTTENRFLKYFLEEINGLCITFINQKIDLELKVKATTLQKKISGYLLNPFFKNIQRLSFIPSSSSVLLKKAGYRDIYYHFVQSKFTFRPLLENQKKFALNSGLKNIACLYELWVFLKIAQLVFGYSQLNEIFQGQVQKYGSLIGAYKWSTNDIELYYNKSYTKSRGGSYSVTLRPDISLKIGDKLYLFDAKYKFNTSEADPDVLVRVVKPEDIHKMHAYLDAIHLAKAAMVVYPGTQMIFYHRNNLEDGQAFDSGVGAIPFSPNAQEEIDFVLQILKQQTSTSSTGSMVINN